MSIFRHERIVTNKLNGTVRNGRKRAERNRFVIKEVYPPAMKNCNKIASKPI